MNLPIKLQNEEFQPVFADKVDFFQFSQRVNDEGLRPLAIVGAD